MTWTTLQRSKLTEHIWGWTGGSGPTLMLIHGVGMRADYWSNLIPALEQHFSLIVIDMPGHGESPVLTTATKKIKDYTNCIAHVLVSQKAPVLLAGHSMGALISVDLASRFSKYVRAICVLNGVFQRDEFASKAVRLRADNLDGRSVGDPSQTLERWFGHTPQGVDAVAAQQCKDWLLSINPLGYREAYTAFAYDDGPLESALRGLECPALFTTGELEPNSTPAMSRSMASLTPMGECYEFKGAKHMMSMTHGKELSDLMTSFFRQAGALK
ncbi:alpha/beta hydrolase [Granulosicoccus sp.]|nr:alpha/beta hydrolase [Granulosicoccus sp.]MDB4222203.1 alpha/beta hydrolase [Granulosicoccus sp.]